MAIPVEQHFALVKLVIQVGLFLTLVNLVIQFQQQELLGLFVALNFINLSFLA